MCEGQQLSNAGWFECSKIEIKGPLDGLGDEEHKRSWVSTVRPIQDLIVFLAIIFKNHGHGISGLHEKHVHHQPGGAAVTVKKRVNVNKPVMRSGGQFDLMEFSLICPDPSDQRLHLRRNLIGFRRGVFGTCDHHRTGAVFAGVFRFGLAHHQVVKLPDQNFRDGDSFTGNHFKQKIQSLPMIFCLQVIFEGLAFDGHPLLQDEKGFAQGETVALDGIGVEGHLDLKLFPQFFNLRGRERPQGIQARQLFVDPLPDSRVHGRHAAIMA